MATYRGIFTCGHEGEIREVGSGRAERAAWKFENHVCPDCYEEELKAKARKEIKAAANNGLPELEGSEKQIAWAIKIRQEWIKQAKEFALPYRQALADKMDGADDKGLFQAGLEAIDKVLERKNNASAKFWIESRHEHPYNLAKEAATAAGKKYLGK